MSSHGAPVCGAPFRPTCRVVIVPCRPHRVDPQTSRRGGYQTGRNAMGHGMGFGTGFGWLFGILILILTVSAIAALIKYLRK